MTLKHSPAPWTTCEGDSLDELYIYDSDSLCVAHVFGIPEAKHEGPERDRILNDAKLIESAPEMYALLREAAIWFNRYCVDFPIVKKIERLLNDMEELALTLSED